MADKSMHDGTPSIALILSKMKDDRTGGPDGLKGPEDKADGADDPKSSLKMALGALKDALMSKDVDENALCDAWEACFQASENMPHDEAEEPGQEGAEPGSEPSDSGAYPGDVKKKSNIGDGTSTSSDVRSPTSTSTKAHTSDNFTATVTGGAGSGATNVHIHAADKKPKGKSPYVEK
jgi:hypothetical protein